MSRSVPQGVPQDAAQSAPRSAHRSAPRTAGPTDRALDSVIGDLARLEALFEGWEDEQKAALIAYRRSIDDLHKEALRRLIAALKSDPAAVAAMVEAVKDPVVYAVLRHHGLLKPSLQERVETALESVRPMLASHGGGVELVSVAPPDTVEVRFQGNCDGCPASALTFIAGVKKAIETHCPEIAEIKQAKGLAGANGSADGRFKFVSPFAKADEGDWLEAAGYDDIPDGDVLAKTLGGEPVLLSRNGAVVSCFQNACAHLGLPLDAGEIRDGVLTCPHHGFQYELASGECLTAPEVQLRAHAVRVVGDRVEVRLAR